MARADTRRLGLLGSLVFFLATPAFATSTELIGKSLDATPEFSWIAARAQALGVTVSLAGETATRYATAILAASRRGELPPTDISLIFPSHKDLMLAVEGPQPAVRQLEDEVRAKIPYPGGAIENVDPRREPGAPYARYARWRFDESRTLGEREPLRDGTLHLRLGGAAISSEADERAIELLERRELRVEGERFAAEPTARLLQVLAVIRFASQNGLAADDSAVKAIEIALVGVEGKVRPSPRLFRVANEIFEDSVDLPATYALVERIHLASALKPLTGDPVAARKDGCSQECFTAARWLFARKPLPGFPVGAGDGKTAAQLGLSAIAHATRGLHELTALEASLDGSVNAIKSIEGAGQKARFGEGLYALKGRTGYAGDLTRMYTLRAKMKPEAREGSDFTLERSGEWGTFPVILNRNAVTVDPLPTPWTLSELFDHVKQRSKGKALYDPKDAFETDEAARYDLTMRTLNRRMNFLDPEEVARVEKLVERQIDEKPAHRPPFIELYFDLAISTRRPDLAARMPNGTPDAVVRRAWWQHTPELLDGHLKQRLSRDRFAATAFLPRYAKRFDLFEKVFGAAYGGNDRGPAGSTYAELLAKPHYQHSAVVRELVGNGPLDVATVHEALRKDPGAVQAIARTRDKAALRRMAARSR